MRRPRRPSPLAPDLLVPGLLVRALLVAALLVAALFSGAASAVPAAAVAGTAAPGVAAPAAAVRPGASSCPRGQTALGGSLTGDPDGAPLNALVGIELTDAAARRAYDVPADGTVDLVGRPAGVRYSVVDLVNPARTAATAAAHGDRTWGAPGGPGVLCFATSSRIALAHLEIYPRRPVDDDGDGRTDRHVTDRSRYGAAAHYRQAVLPGGLTTVALRLPQNIRSRVGFVDGSVTWRGRAVPVAAERCGRPGRPACRGITAVRAFPVATHGADCGIEGFSASADRLVQGAATTYGIGSLAGGRCGAPAQLYSVRVTCVSVCGGPTRTVGPPRPVAVRAGGGVRADVSFG